MSASWSSALESAWSRGAWPFPFFSWLNWGGCRLCPRKYNGSPSTRWRSLCSMTPGKRRTSNLEQRIWAPSRPVIHLAAAAAIAGQQLRKSGYPLALESLLFHRWIIEAVARLAEELETLIAKDPKFPVKPEQLIRFRLG